MAISSGIQLGPYRIIAMLGKGGMGEVYQAHDTRLDRTVAVKVLPFDSVSDSSRVQRFEQEAKAASARNHPNILTIYDFGVANPEGTDGTYYMAMEYVEGVTLRQLIAAGRLPLPQALDIAAQCASGLAAAHAAGIIHRDIKPENIMVRPDGYVKILDFGLAKLAEAPFGEPALNSSLAATALTGMGQILGTWQYMSPEQARGQEVDQRTDVWSLGTVLYEMVTGTSPFAAPTMSDTLACILHRDPPPLSQYGIAASDSLSRMMNKAMSKEREDRFRLIREMGLELKQLAREMEVSQSRTDQNELGSLSRALLHSSPPASATPEAAQVATVPSMPWFRRAPVIATGILVAGLAVWGIRGGQTRVAPYASLAPGAPQPPSEAQAPMRQLSYSLRVQKMRNGRPYQQPFRATGREILEDGWKVQFEFSFPSAGSLYLLDDAPGSDGRAVLSIVFPTPSVNGGSAQVMAYKSVQSGWLVLDETPGRERFWLVWASKPLPELERAREMMFAARESRQDDPQIIRNAELNQAVRAMLARTPAATASVDNENKQTSLSGRGDVVVSTMELEHR